MLPTRLIVTLFVSCLHDVNTMLHDGKSLARGGQIDNEPVRPWRYIIDLVPHYEINSTYDGTLKILFSTHLPMWELVLIKDKSITIDPASVQVHYLRVVPRLRELRGLPTSNDTAIVIPFKHFIFQDSDYSVFMKFKGKIRNDRTGFYKSYYKDWDGTKRSMWVIKLLTSDIPKVIPCFYDFRKKVLVSLNISRPNVMAISNMPPQTKPTKHYAVKKGDWRYWESFGLSPPIFLSELSLLVANFSNYDVLEDDFAVYKEPWKAIEDNRGWLALRKLYRLFKTYTGASHVMPKFDLVVLPDFESGVTPSTGLAFISKTLFCVEDMGLEETDVKCSSPLLKFMTLGHLLTHQWFGSFVTPNFTYETWMSEGFAEYLGFIVMGNLHRLVDEGRTIEQKMFHMINSLMVFESETDWPDSYSSSVVPHSIAALSDAKLYSKGLPFVHMIKSMLSNETCQELLSKYSKKRDPGFTNSWYLKDKMDKILKQYRPELSNITFWDLVENFGKTLGYPVVHVKRNYKKSTAEVTQEHFTIGRSNNGSLTWFIPLSFATPTSTKDDYVKGTDLWMKPSVNKMTVNLKAKSDQWVLFNAGLQGYYRVNYDKRNWEMLIEYLDSDSYINIPRLNRAQLIEDSYNLARNGLITYCIPLSLSRYMKRDMELAPLEAFMDNIGFVHKRLIHRTTSFLFKAVNPNSIEDNYIQKYIVSCIEPFEDDERLFKSRFPAVRDFVSSHAYRLRVAQFESSAIELVVNFTKQSNPDWNRARKHLFCTGIETGLSRLWDSVMEMYINTKSATRQAFFIDVLGCSLNKNQINTYLQMSVDAKSKIRKEHRYDAFLSVLNNVVDPALDLFIKNSKAMVKLYGKKVTFETLLRKISNALTTKEQISKLKKFIKRNRSKKSRNKALNAASEVVDTTLIWLDKNVKMIELWLKNDALGLDNSNTCNPAKAMVRGNIPSVSSSKSGGGLALKVPAACVLVTVLGVHLTKPRC